MKSIKLKLILANVGVVLFSVLLITIPVVVIQFNTKLEEITDDAEDKISQGHAQINLFMQQPITMIHTVGHYLDTHPDNQTDIEEFFEQLLKGKEDFSELYYAGAVPVKDGGYFGQTTDGIRRATMTRRRVHGSKPDRKQLWVAFLSRIRILTV